MQVAPEITFHGIEHSDYNADYIQERIQRLEHLTDDIIACRVTVERPHRNHRQGNAYHVRVELTLPKHRDLIAKKEAGQRRAVELRTVIKEAFEAVEKQVKEVSARQRNQVKVHEQPSALVVRIDRDAGFGFIKAPGGEEFYFHRNSVLHNDFDRLEVGTEVRFEPEMGEDGPQASTVQLINKPGVRAVEDRAREDVPAEWRS